mmetsp:Transcript_54188/g.171969  ORF Transcript_54188/g.171969 Transcript_54188/m.171969 type:complete len:204 (+) Transcript_54188:211-822(+)
MPLSCPLAYSSNLAFTSSGVAALASSNTQSVREPLRMGTRTARPFSLPLSSGKIRAMAVADPVEVGARLVIAERARRRSSFLLLGASTTVCVLVTLWMVVMDPRTIPKHSFTTLTTGARQLVVQLAAVTMWSLDGSYWSSLHPTTMFSTGSASLTGADTSTFFTPLSKKGCSFARVRNFPEHSITTSTPNFAQSTSPGEVHLV